MCDRLSTLPEGAPEQVLRNPISSLLHKYVDAFLSGPLPQGRRLLTGGTKLVSAVSNVLSLDHNALPELDGWRIVTNTAFSPSNFLLRSRRDRCRHDQKLRCYGVEWQMHDLGHSLLSTRKLNCRVYALTIDAWVCNDPHHSLPCVFQMSKLYPGFVQMFHHFITHELRRKEPA